MMAIVGNGNLSTWAVCVFSLAHPEFSMDWV